MIFFRVDSSQAIGSGHIMRCLTLARQLQDSYDSKIIFLSKPHAKNIIHLIKEYGFEVMLLSCPIYDGSIEEATWLGADQEDDAHETAHIISSLGSDDNILIIDHYAIDITWENILRPYVKKIIVIDDLANRTHNCDILLDQNFYLDQKTRYTNLVPSDCRLILGPEYAILRPEFYEHAVHYKFSADIKNIFVYFGGIDATSMTLRTLDILKNHSNIHAHIVSSKNCADWDKISNICRDTTHFTLHYSVQNMAKLIASCDAAIGAGGTTQWERMIINIPSFVVSIANNQTKICEDVSTSGYYYYAGECSSLDQNKYKTMLDGFILNVYLRKSFFEKAKTIEFKKSNVVKSISYVPLLNIRNATLKDAQNLFNWRTHPSNRIHAHCSSDFSLSSHMKWFNNVLEGDQQYLYIISHNDVDVGVVRFDVMDQHNLISIYLVPDMHNKGYGKNVLRTAEKYFRRHVNNKPFTAEILSNNIASMHLFTKLGYKINKSFYIKN